MAKIQPSTRSFSAGSVFLPGGSITFGNAGIVPDPDNPATLKAVYLDEAQTQIAQNPQPLDSNASFQQASDGILYGTGTYSVVWKNAAGVEVYQNLNFELQEDFGTAAFVNTGTGTGQLPTADQLNVVGEINFSSANLNRDTLGGEYSGDFIASGEAVSATTAAFTIRNVKVSKPSSITVTSNFTVSNLAGGIYYGTTTFIALGAASSNALVYILAYGLSGMTAGERVYLRQGTSTSKIEIS